MWMTAASDIGQRRTENQDTYRTGNLPQGGYLLVCDGMGGERGGGVAAAIAADIVAERIERDITNGMGETSVRRVLESAGAAANAAVYAKANSEVSLTGMGTTLTALAVTGTTAHILHAGDSRAYLLRGGLLNQLTTDHTVVQLLVDRGEITAQSAANHPQRHYITRAVGVEKQVLFDVFTIDLQAWDLLLLCSDGLYNEIPPADLAALLVLAGEKRSASPLIAAANRGGGRDNITAAVCCIGEEENAHG